MTLRIQGFLDRREGRASTCIGLGETEMVGWPPSPLLAREQLRPHQGVLLSDRPGGRGAQPLPAMKETFQSQRPGSRKHPTDGPSQHGPGPTGPRSSPQTAGRLPTAGLLRGFGWGEAARAKDGAWALDPSDLGLHLSDL